MKYKSPTKPMSQQREYLRRLKRRPSDPSDQDVFAVLGEMGTGKTKMVLDDWMEGVSAGSYDALMVISGAGSYRNWFEAKSDEQPAEMEKHLDPRLADALTTVPWFSGMSKTKREQFQRLLARRSGPRAMFVNVEALSTVDECVAACEDFLRGSKCMLVVDESTKIKGGRAERTKILTKRLGPLAVARRIATGRVTPRSPMDLYWQYHFLDWRILGFESPLGFRNRYAITEKRCYLPNEVVRVRFRAAVGVGSRGEARRPESRLRSNLMKVRAHLEERTDTVARMDRDTAARKLYEHSRTMGRDDMLAVIEAVGGRIEMVTKIKEYQNLEELHEKIAPYSYRVLKSECMDLPPKVYEPRDVALTDEQRRVYRQMRDKAIAELDSGGSVTATTVVAKMLRLHQIVCGHVREDDTREIRDVKSNRIKEILDVLEEHEGKAVIWTTYQHELRKIADALRDEYGPEAVALFYGGNRSTRGADERRFLSDAECRFMVSTQAAGGFGNTWTVADLEIYAANSYDLELREQSEDRLHRRGQTRKVTIVDLIARGTVEEKIIKVLRQKIDLASIVTGDSYREWLV